MAQNINSIRSIFLIAFFLSSTQLHASIEDTIVKTYQSQIGVKELTGKNDGMQVEKYLSSVNLSKGNPWCAAFVHWVLQRSGVIQIPKSGYSPSWFPNKSTIYTTGKQNNQTPKPADVFGIYFAEKKRIAHVGFIHKWEPGSYCITVEGNTNQAGSREGDGVLQKRRLKKQIYKVSRWTKTPSKS